MASKARAEGHEADELRAWKLFALLPSMLLHRARDEKRVARDALIKRCDDFSNGDWAGLHEDALSDVVHDGSRAPGRLAQAAQVQLPV